MFRSGVPGAVAVVVPEIPGFVGCDRLATPSAQDTALRYQGCPVRAQRLVPAAIPSGMRRATALVPLWTRSSVVRVASDAEAEGHSATPAYGAHAAFGCAARAGKAGPWNCPPIPLR